MEKLTDGVDVVGILDRMVAATNSANIAELAKKLGLSPQALGQARKRSSISLLLLLTVVELSKKTGGVTLDYLVFGDKAGVTPDGTMYIRIPKISGGNVQFPAELLRPGIVTESLLAYVQDSKLSIIDTNDKSVGDGLYAFGDPTRPLLRQCSLRIDGRVLIAGEDAKTVTELDTYGIIGKVIWSGKAE